MSGSYENLRTALPNITDPVEPMDVDMDSPGADAPITFNYPSPEAFALSSPPPGITFSSPIPELDLSSPIPGLALPSPIRRPAFSSPIRRSARSNPFRQPALSSSRPQSTFFRPLVESVIRNHPDPGQGTQPYLNQSDDDYESICPFLPAQHGSRTPYFTNPTRRSTVTATMPQEALLPQQGESSQGDTPDDDPPLWLQEFANNSVIRMYNNHPDAFSGPLDQTTLPYPAHPSASIARLAALAPPLGPPTVPRQRRSGLGNRALNYDPLWMRTTGEDESLLEEFYSRKKFEELFLHHVIRVGDEMVADVMYPTGSGQVAGRGIFHVDNFTQTRRFPNLTFTLVGTPISIPLLAVNGVNEINTFLTNNAMTLVTADGTGISRNLHVFRGAQHQGSFHYVRQAYQVWFDMQNNPGLTAAEAIAAGGSTQRHRT